MRRKIAGSLVELISELPIRTPRSLVRLWNYHIALEDYSVMQGQAHNIDDFGAPHLKVVRVSIEALQIEVKVFNVLKCSTPCPQVNAQKSQC